MSPASPKRKPRGQPAGRRGPRPQRSGPTDTPAPPHRAGADSAALGARIRAERERQKRSLREFARSLDISASMISQIECGRAMPSVGTLFAIATALNLPFDQLFANGEAQPERRAPPDQPTEAELVQRHDRRKSLRLENDVRWERLTALPDDQVEFVHVVYEPGAMSAPDKAVMRHGGKEYGYLVSGRLGLQVGDREIVLEPGDSISFNSQLPHRLWTIGDARAVAIWFIVGRTDDPRRFGEAAQKARAPKRMPRLRAPGGAR